MPYVTHETRLISGRHKRVWVCRCDNCVRIDEKVWSDLADPQIAEKNYRNQGWNVGKSNICPDCMKAQKASQQQHERKVVEMTVTTVSKPDVRQPTSDERLRIRQMLDSNFDDAKGMYLDGYSDQRIGKELDLPWAMVARIREAAYGPIRTDPELEGLRTKAGEIKAEVNQLQVKVDALNSQLSALFKRMSDIDNRFSKAG